MKKIAIILIRYYFAFDFEYYVLILFGLSTIPLVYENYPFDILYACVPPLGLIPFLFKKNFEQVSKKQIIELGKSENISFGALVKITKLHIRIFVSRYDDGHDFDMLDKDLKVGLRKKNKWQGLVSTANLYDYAEC